MTILSPAQQKIAGEFLRSLDHGGGAAALERHLSLASGELLDLSASMNPAAPDSQSLLAGRIWSLRSYPDSMRARSALAEAIGVEEGRLVVCNGGAEAISLVAQVVRSGSVTEPEFSLYKRAIRSYDPQGPRWASNPNNPTGALLENGDVPKVVDEAFYQIATGTWSRRDFDRGSFVIGSLTKLFALPGLRVGYVVAPTEELAARLASFQPEWSVNSLAAVALPDLIASVDLEKSRDLVAGLRAELCALLSRYGSVPTPSSANYVYVPDGMQLFDKLLENGILARDTSSFGLAGGVRIAVPNSDGLDRIDLALFPRKRTSKSRSGFKGSLMVVGTSSDSGKSTLVTALCRIISDRGLSVAPFKAQNMSLNSAVTPDGFEIGRAQARQAHAARIDPEVSMNPILLKPTSELTSQVVVMGEPLFEMGAREYQSKKRELVGLVLDAYNELASRYEVVILEGAGSPAEINLLDNDIVNLGLARRIGSKALLVGDIDRGGVFASLYGTLQILPPELSVLVRGFAINKIRGDASLLESGVSKLEALSGRPVFGVIPHMGRFLIDSEDSLSLADYFDVRPRGETQLDIAIVALPRISNFTDFDPLVLEPHCSVRKVVSAGQLGDPDLIIIPGSKSTVEDLDWMKVNGFEAAIRRQLLRGCSLLGICGGFQILGKELDDSVESGSGLVKGLGLLNVTTKFLSSKVTLVRYGRSKFFDGVSVSGYQIYHGRVTALDATPLFELSDPVRGFEGVGLVDGAVGVDGNVFGTTLHGVLENDEFRDRFLGHVARLRSKSFRSELNFAGAREEQVDFLAGFVSKYVDVSKLLSATSIDLGSLEV